MPRLASLLLAPLLLSSTLASPVTHDAAHAVRAFASRLSRAQLSLVERFATNRDAGFDAAVSAAALHSETTEHGRETQAQLLAIVQLVQQQCQNELAAVETLQPQAQDIQALIDCVKQAFRDVVDQCLAAVPGIKAPVDCLIDLGVNQDGFNEAVASDSGVFGGTGSIGDGSSGSDSANNIDDKFNEVSDFNQAITAAKCNDLFGNAGLPDVFACLAIFNVADFDQFKQLIEDAFKNIAACQELAQLLGLTTAGPGFDFFDEFFFDDLHFLDNSKFDLCSQDLVKQELDGFNQVFAQCSQVDNGALQEELNARFVAGAAPQAFSSGVAVLMAIIAAAIAAL